MIGHQDAAAQHGLLSIPDAALAAGVSTRTIRRWIAEGLPTVRIAGRDYLAAADLATRREPGLDLMRPMS